jgi:hypothetical protein
MLLFVTFPAVGGSGGVVGGVGVVQANGFESENEELSDPSLPGTHPLFPIWTLKLPYFVLGVGAGTFIEIRPAETGVTSPPVIGIPDSPPGEKER